MSRDQDVTPKKAAAWLANMQGVRTPSRVALAQKVCEQAEALAAEQAKVRRVEALAQERCETFTPGSGTTCVNAGPSYEEDPYYGLSPDAPYGANRYCAPCRLRAALAVQPEQERRA